MPPKRRSNASSGGPTGNTPRRTNDNNNTQGEMDTTGEMVVGDHHNHDDDIDNQSVDSAATNHSLGSRSSARLKRKREMSLSATTSTTTTTTSKILNFDTVLEVEEEEDDEAEEEGRLATTHSRSKTPKKKVHRHNRNSAKRTKLNSDNDQDDKVDDDVIMEDTDANIVISKELSDKPSNDNSSSNDKDDDDDDGANVGYMKTDFIATEITGSGGDDNEDRQLLPVVPGTTSEALVTTSTTVTTTTAAAMIPVMTPHHQYPSLTVATTERISWNQPSSAPTEAVVPLPPIVQLPHNTIPEKPTITAISTIPNQESLLQYYASSSTTITHNPRVDDTVVRVVDKGRNAVDYTNEIDPVPNDKEDTNRIVNVSGHCESDDTETDAVVAIEDETVTTTNIRSSSSRYPYHQSTMFWCIVILVLQVVFYPIWIHPILSSTVDLSRFLLSTVYRRNYNDKSNIVEDRTMKGPMNNGLATTDEILYRTVNTVQQLQQELQTLVQQEQMIQQQLTEWTLILSQKQRTDEEDENDIPDNNTSNNITELIQNYEIMIQNRIVELSKSVQQLQSFNSTIGTANTRLEMMQQYHQQQQEENDRRSRNIFLLDLSRSDFLDTLTSPTTTSSRQNDTDINCNANDNATNEGDVHQQPPPSVPLLQHHEMDDAVQELQTHIRDIIQTTIFTSSTTMEQIRSWIHDEIQNETRNIVKQTSDDVTTASAGSGSHSNNSNNDIVQKIVTQRLLEKQSDIAWHHDNDGDSDIIHFDYASIVHGSTILYSSPSLIQTLPIFNRILSMLQLRFYGHTAEMILTPKITNDRVSELGQCWSFLRNQPAMVVIQMGQSIDISSVSIEHPFLSTTETAIQTFHVYGHEDITLHHVEQQQQFLHRIPTLLSNHSNSKEDGWYYLGTFEYDISKSILGTNGLVNFPILQTNGDGNVSIPPLRILRLHINPVNPVEDETGTVTPSKYQYSCLYRFRVHGEPSSSSS